ncbi:peptidase S1 and S6, chymotrypsin/Hap [Roseibacterium elongatum DSM 19469]|uniref:Peptidase S1 and S6, chymotrypsin/Hap n=1 Tax=Roseicyclus elongatus DSM 19469 TaxID=1294273 RepID=W8SNB3_9RHOB|nr:hypothetical protein [Roseibacterium elongatum]AHM04005.1 peptidase S1 and S6, chymotrypsin/Hap [Roseibacterium elongatum DSM 19469]
MADANYPEEMTMAPAWSCTRIPQLALALAVTLATPAAANDTCRWANDGDCDDPSIYGAVSGLCDPGTDTSDCTGYVPPLDISDICLFANDGECDDPSVAGHVTTSCAPGTDNTDCGIVSLEPMEPMDDEPLGDACPPGTIVVDGRCIDEDLMIEEEPAAEK